MEALTRITDGAPPLHTAEVSRLAIPNRVFAVLYASALLTLFYHHIVTLASLILTKGALSSLFISFSLLAADLVLAFMWATQQAFRMWPLQRRESPEILKKIVTEKGNFCHLPAMDVFICTSDPYKEPPMKAVNTALSAMAFDYPPEKVSVYVSDDGGSALTLFAFFEAAKFAAHWLPFCRQNNVARGSPEDFFAARDQSLSPDAEKMKILYGSLKLRVESVVERGKVGDEYITGEEDRQAFAKWTDGFTRHDHPTVIQVILDKSKDRDVTNHSMPNLIYVSREKSRASFSNFKAGALNVLIRVSATMTNAPITLQLDCDMSSNDPGTPLRALCYFSDPKVQSEVAYIQFPQRFRGINKDDIYGCELKRIFVINSKGLDGLVGPNHVGTGCFFNRRAFFGGPSAFVAPELLQLSPKSIVDKAINCPEVLELAYTVAGCNYESRTQWGYQIGVRYGTLVEDVFTGYTLQCEGWKSVFCNPEKAAFYGDAPISLVDVLNQNKRWSVGLLQMGFSKYSPLTYGALALGPIPALAYANYGFWPIWTVPITIYAFIPQLALLNGIAVFPKVSEQWFFLYLFLFFGAYGQDLVDFLAGGGTVKRWWNDSRIWLIRGLSCFLFGSIEFLAKSLGVDSFSFDVTSKVVDEEQSERYEQGIFEFGLHSSLFVTLAMAAIVNGLSLVLGLVTVFRGENDLGEILIQLLLSAFAVGNCRPVYEAMILRINKGGIPIKTTLMSTFLASSLTVFACIILRF